MKPNTHKRTCSQFI